MTLTGQHPNPSASAEQASAHQREANALEYIAATYHQEAERAERPPKSDPCGPYQYSSNAELCAEWKSADASADAARWTAWATSLSAISLIAVAFAIYLTIQSNRIARDTARRQLRAYVCITAVTQTEHIPQQWRIQVEWINAGETPAKNVTLSADWRDFPQGVPEDFDFPAQPLRPSEGAAAVGPGQPLFVSCERRLPLWLLPKIAEGKARVVLWASADYTDVFGETHRTEFAAKLGAEQLFSGQFGTTWDAIHRHNGIDDDCMKKPYQDYPQLKPA